MGNWIIAPGEVHKHDMPEGSYERDTIWGCACGQRFRYAPDNQQWYRDDETKFNKVKGLWV
jgi:hypothetical protein